MALAVCSSATLGFDEVWAYQPLRLFRRSVGTVNYGQVRSHPGTNSHEKVSKPGPVMNLPDECLVQFLFSKVDVRVVSPTPSSFPSSLGSDRSL